MLKVPFEHIEFPESLVEIMHPEFCLSGIAAFNTLLATNRNPGRLDSLLGGEEFRE
jgi:hypothetical protein